MASFAFAALTPGAGSSKTVQPAINPMFAPIIASLKARTRVTVRLPLVVIDSGVRYTATISEADADGYAL